MKPRSTNRILPLAGTIAALLGATVGARAANYYWDANGNLTATVAATGTWGSSNFWSTDSTGSSATSFQTIDGTSDLFFSAGSNSTGGTVTVSLTQAAHSLTFDDATGGITLNGGTAINLGSAVAGSGLFFTNATGSANTINTGLILNSAATAISITNSGTALQTIGAITGAASSGTQTLSLSAINTGGITLNGIISDGGNGGKLALSVNSGGTGITTLSAANTYTGDTTLGTGSLKLDFSAVGAPSSNIINNVANTSALKFSGGGTLTLTGATGATNSQRWASTSLDGGAVITLAQNGATTLSTSLGAITRTTGGTLNFSTIPLTSGVIATTSNALSTPLGTWATVGSGTTLSYATVNASGQIVAMTGTAAATAANLTDTLGTANYDLALATGTVQASMSANTIRFTEAANTTAPGATLFKVNGLINSGSGLWTIGTNAITIGDNNELVIATGTSGITINSVIGGAAGAGLTYGGTGALTLSKANTYTGTTTINSGTLNLGIAAALNSASSLVINGGTFGATTFADTVAAVTLRSGSITGTTGILTSTAAWDLQSGTVGTQLAGTNGLNKTTVGTVTLSPVTTGGTLTGNINIKAGTLVMGGTAVICFDGANTINLGESGTGADARLAVQNTQATYANPIVLTTGATGNLSIGNQGTTAVTFNNANTVTGTNNLTISNTTTGGLTLANVNNTGTITNSGAGTGALTITSYGSNVTGLSQSSGGALTLTGATIGSSQSWTNNSASTLTFGSVAAGTNTLTLAGSGNYTVAASSTFTGSTAAITFSGSGLFDFRSFTAPTTTGTLTVSGGGRLFHNGNLGSAQNITISSGYLEDYFNNNFTRALGTGANQVQITGGVSGFSENGDGSTVNLGGAGATITWGSATFNPTQFILGASTMQGNSTRNTFLNLTNGIDLAGGARTIRQDQIDGNGGATINQRVATGTTITGNIINGSGTGSLTKEGSGRLTLSGTNTYNGGTTINAGTLRFSNLVSMPATGALSVNTGAILGISVGSAGQWTTGSSGVGTVGGLLSGLGGQGSSTVSYSGNVGVELINATAQTYSGNIADVGTTLTLLKSGAGILTLGGTNSYTGTTRVFAGTLQFGKTASLYNGTTGNWTAANLNVQTGATLAFNVGGSGEFTTGNVTTLLGNLATSSSLTSGMNAGSSLGFDTTNAAGGTFSISDVLADVTGTMAGARGVTKLGTNTLVLSTTNTYTGTTTVSGGTLIVSGGAAIANAGLVTLGNVAGATFQLNNSETIGNLSGGGGTGGTVALQGYTLTVGDGTSQTYSGNFTGTSSSALIKQGSGTLTLSATSLPGTATINAGMLAFNTTTVLSGGTITLGANGSGVLFNTAANKGVSGLGGVTISNNIVLGNSVTTTGARLWASQNAGSWNFTGNITGAAGAAGAQTLLFDSRAGGTTGGDRTTTLISGVIADGNQPLNLNFAITPQTSSTAANNHPAYVNLTGLNTFTGSLTATRGNGGATSWLTIGGERWSDGPNNTPTYGRMGSGRLGDNNSGVYAGAINFGSTSTNIVNLDYFSSANQTWSGVIGGGTNNNGALVKEGTGTLTLTNANLYNRLTTIGGGTLALGFGSTTTNILPSGTALNMGLGTSYYSDSTAGNAVMTISGGGGGGTLQLAGAAASATQTVASLTIATNTANSIMAGANRTLTITSGTITIGTNSGLNFNTAAGGADASSSTVGTSIVVFGAAPTAFTNGFTVTDSTGFGLGTVNGSNQVIRITGTSLLPASTATSATDYRIDNNAGGSAAVGSSNIAITASQAAKSITVDTTAASGTLTLNSGIILSNNIWNFGGNGSNTYNITGSAGGAGIKAVASGDTFVINNFNTGTVTFASPLLANGANAFVVGGPGTVVLTGVNTFTGATTINSGTLQISGSGSLQSGSYAGAIAINGGSTLRYSSSIASQTLSGAISGPGGITKDTNTGDLLLSGTNTYSGTTSVSAGRIIASAIAGVSSGATSIVQSGTGQFLTSGTGLTYANSFSINTLGYTEAGDLTVTDGAIRSDGSNTFSGTITLSGNSRIGAYGNARVNTISGRITGSGAMSFYGLNSANNDAQTYILSNTAKNYTGDTQIDNKDYVSARTGNLTTLKLGASNVIPDGAAAGSVAFNGAGVDDLTVLDLNGFNDTINGLSAVAAAGARITNTAAAANSVLTIGANDITSTFSGTITDSGAGRTLAITKIGTGTLTLSGAGNNYLGGTNLSAGILSFASGALGSSGNITFTANSTLQWGSSNTQDVSARLVLANGVTSTLDLGANDVSFASAIGSSSSGALTKTGTGKLTLVGTNTYTGATTVTAGTLQIGNGSTTGSLSTTSAITNNGTLVFNRSNAVVQGTDFNSVIGGTGGNVIQIGSSSLVLNGTNTYSGTTTIQSGSLVAGANAAASGDGAFANSSGGALVLGNASTLAGSAPSLFINGSFTVGRDITVGSLTNTNAYNATIGGSNTSGTSVYTGGITFNATAANYSATLQAATGGTVDFQGAFTTNNKAIAIGSSGNTGTVKLTNTLSTTGGVSVNFGTLLLGSSDRLGDTTPITVAGGILDTGTAFTDTVSTFNMSSGALNGTGTLTATTYGLSGGTVTANLGTGTMNVTGSTALNGAAGATE